MVERGTALAAHVWPLRVYYEDTDAGGVVYHANYLKFAERARTEWLRQLGIAQSELLVETGVAFAVRRCEVDFMAPARLDDRLEVHTRLLAVTGATIAAEQIVCRDAVELARLHVTVACIKRDGRPTRIPTAIARALSPGLGRARHSLNDEHRQRDRNG